MGIALPISGEKRGLWSGCRRPLPCVGILLMATDAQLQNLAVRECNVTADTEIPSLVETWWSLTSGETSILRYHKLRKSILRYLQGKLRSQVDTTIGTDRVLAFQQFQAVSRMIGEENIEIERLEAGGSSIPKLGSVSTRPRSYDPDAEAIP